MGLGEESDAFQELKKAKVFQHCSSMYHTVMGSWYPTRVLHDKLSSGSSNACMKMLKTRPGKKVDEVLAGVTKKARRAAAVGIFLKKLSVLKDTLIGWIQFFFRYFLPMMLLRWIVDFQLFLSEAALAFWRDFARWDIGQWTCNEESAPTELREQEQEPKEKKESESDRELRNRPTRRGFFYFIRALITSLIARFVQLVYYLTNLVNLFFIIPILTYQIMFLTAISDFLHQIAGLDKIDNEFQNRQRQFITSNLLHSPQEPAREMLKNKWLLDSVLDYYVGMIRKNPYFAKKLDDLGIRRPIKFSRNIHRFVTKHINNVIECDLVPYLKMDPNYKESEDKDFKPVEIESDDDSLEYAEDDDLGAEDASLKDANEDKDNNDA